MAAWITRRCAVGWDDRVDPDCRLQGSDLRCRRRRSRTEAGPVRLELAFVVGPSRTGWTRGSGMAPRARQPVATLETSFELRKRGTPGRFRPCRAVTSARVAEPVARASAGRRPVSSFPCAILRNSSDRMIAGASCTSHQQGVVAPASGGRDGHLRRLGGCSGFSMVGLRRRGSAHRGVPTAIVPLRRPLAADGACTGSAHRNVVRPDSNTSMRLFLALA